MDIDMDETLGEILSSRDYALSLSPGFFRFYAHTVRRWHCGGATCA